MSEGPSMLGRAVAEHEGLVDHLTGMALSETRLGLGTGPLTAMLVRQAVQAAQAAVDALQAPVLRNVTADGRRIGCRAGCTPCCHQPVTVSTAELFMIARSLVEQDERAALAARCAAQLDKLGGDAWSRQRTALSLPCPLLERQNCGIYELRPIGCRTHFSLSRTDCEREWRRRTHAHPGGKGVPQITTTKAIGVGVTFGLDAGLHERGLEIELVELTEGLPVMLRGADRWLAGERIFAGVRTDSDLCYADFLNQILATHPRPPPGRGSDAPVPLRAPHPAPP